MEEKTNNPAAALEHYRLIVLADPDNLVALNNLASVLNESAKNPDEALPFAEKAYQGAPGSAAVNDTLGWVFYQKRIYTRAVHHLETAVKLQPTAKRKAHLALAYHQTGADAQARKTLAEALALDPDLGETQGDLAAILSAPAHR